MYRYILRCAGKMVLAVEDWGDRIFTPRYNPLYYLGALAIFFMWVLVASGIYLLIFYKISAPYESIKYITEEQWYLGGAIRSIHRYAADGMVIASVLHLIHVYFTDRYRQWRWVAWVSGIFLLAAIWVTGIVGYWMVWDERGQIVADLTARFLDYLPIFGESLSLSFSHEKLITNLFFFVALFIHIVVPVLLFIVLWIHVIRISRPVINPPRIIAIIAALILTALSIIKPATILLPADTSRIVSIIGIDWLYLFVYPLLNAIPVWLSWVFIAGGAFMLTVVPWLLKSKRPSPAAIIKENCTGCRQCFEDCPYEAIHIMPRTDSKPYDLEAIIIPKRCASCGICVGSCNFSAVDFPEKTEKAVLDEIATAFSTVKPGNQPLILGFICSYSVDVLKIIDPATQTIKDMPSVRVITLPCAGMINPLWIEHGLRSGAEGLFICGCQMGDCHCRLGNKLLEERLIGKRLPILRPTVDRTKLRAYWYSAIHTKELLKEIRAFQEDLGSQRRNGYAPARRDLGKIRIAIASLALALPAVLALYLSDAKHEFHNPGDSMLKVSFKHAGRKIVDCDEAGIIAEEAEKYRKQIKETGKARMNLSRIGTCSRERHPTYLELSIDGEKRLAKSYKPWGWKRDSASFIYRNFILKPGAYKLLIKMRDTADGSRFDYVFDGIVELQPGRIAIIDFDERNKRFFVRN